MVQRFNCMALKYFYFCLQLVGNNVFIEQFISHTDSLEKRLTPGTVMRPRGVVDCHRDD